MITLEWTRVANHSLERGNTYLVKWGRLLSNFESRNTKACYLSEFGNWIVEGEVVSIPHYAFPINLTKHRTTRETFSIGDRVHINDPRTQHWTGTIVAKRNLSRIWVVKDGAGFGTDVNEDYLTKATSRTPPSSAHE